jgi:hypothetical protein
VTADLSRVEELARSETGLCVVSTTRADRTVQATVVNAGILSHPNTGAQVVAFVTRGGSVKHRHLRARPRCTLTFRRGWQWATVEGDAELAGPDDDPGGSGLSSCRPSCGRSSPPPAARTTTGTPTTG